MACTVQAALPKVSTFLLNSDEQYLMVCRVQIDQEELVLTVGLSGSVLPACLQKVWAVGAALLLQNLLEGGRRLRGVLNPVALQQ